MKKLIVVFLASLACLYAFSACGKKDESANVIRVAISPASPPNMFEQNGEYVGLDLEIFEGYCQSRGCSLRITAYDWQGMLGSLSSGRADVAFSGISITEARAQVMDFSRPYLDNTWNLVAMKDRNIVFNELADWKNFTTGYPRGMAYTPFIRDEMAPKGIYSLDMVKLYPSYNEVMADLRNGNIDLAFLDGTVASVYRREHPIEDAYVFSGFDQFGFAFPKGSPLRDDFDLYLDELGEQGLQAIIDKWLN